ncbi:hypothetical protein SLE2022_320370 [Rubroshorea leprosula]
MWRAFSITGLGRVLEIDCPSKRDRLGRQFGLDLNGDGYSLVGEGRRETNSVRDLKMAVTSMQANAELLDEIGFTCLGPGGKKVLGPKGKNVKGGFNHVWVSRVSGLVENGPPISTSGAIRNLLGHPQLKAN